MTRRGFTLIELLVVIAIIAILAAILFPVFARAREKARQASCQSNLKQLALCAHMYKSDYDEMYPPAGACPISSCGNAKTCGYPSTWHQNGVMSMLAPYAKNVNIFYCPSVPTNIATESTRAVPANATFSIPNGLVGYAGYMFLFSRQGDRSGATCYWMAPDQASPMEPLILDQFDSTMLGGGYVNCGTINQTACTNPSFPHNLTLNVAHNDGHVKSYQWNQALFMNGKMITKARAY